MLSSDCKTESNCFNKKYQALHNQTTVYLARFSLLLFPCQSYILHLKLNLFYFDLRSAVLRNIMVLKYSQSYILYSITNTPTSTPSGKSWGLERVPEAQIKKFLPPRRQSNLFCFLALSEQRSSTFSFLKEMSKYYFEIIENGLSNRGLDYMQTLSKGQGKELALLLKAGKKSDSFSFEV